MCYCRAIMLRCSMIDVQYFVYVTLLCQIVCSKSEEKAYNQLFADDEILNLPGLPYKPNFNQYSGYLMTKGPRLLHYW